MFVLVQPVALLAYDEMPVERDRGKMEALTQGPFAPQFFGYYASDLERCALGMTKNCAARILGSGGLHYFSLHESPTRLPTTGNASHPVYHWAALEGLQGLDIPRGENIFASLSLTARASDFLSAELAVQGGENLNSPAAWYHLQRLMVEARWRSLILAAGRRPLSWGQSFEGPLLLSDNATPFDSLSLSSVPYAFDNFLWWLGHLKAEVFLTRMNADRAPKNDWFLGGRLGVKPHPRFEMNVGMIYQWGGKGVHGGSASDTLIEILGGRRNLGSGIHDSSNVTNRSAALDMRWQIPWAPVAVYTEQHFEDCCGGWKNIVNKAYSFLYGVEWAAKDWGPWLVAAEYVYTNDMIYLHQTWPSALSNDSRVAGHPVGRDGEALSLRLSRVGARSHFTWETRLEQREKSTDVHYGQIFDYRPGYQGSQKGIRSELKIGQPLRLGDSMVGRFLRKTDVLITVGGEKDWRKENMHGRDPFSYWLAVGFKRVF